MYRSPRMSLVLLKWTRPTMEISSLLSLSLSLRRLMLVSQRDPRSVNSRAQQTVSRVFDSSVAIKLTFPASLPQVLLGIYSFSLPLPLSLVTEDIQHHPSCPPRFSSSLRNNLSSRHSICYRLSRTTASTLLGYRLSVVLSILDTSAI